MLSGWGYYRTFQVKWGFADRVDWDLCLGFRWCLSKARMNSEQSETELEFPPIGMVITLSFYRKKPQPLIGGNGLQDKSRKKGRPEKEQSVSTASKEWTEASRAQQTHLTWSTLKALPSVPQALLKDPVDHVKWAGNWMSGMLWDRRVAAYRVRQTRECHQTAQWPVTGDIKCWENLLDKVRGSHLRNDGNQN